MNPSEKIQMAAAKALWAACDGNGTHEDNLLYLMIFLAKNQEAFDNSEAIKALVNLLKSKNPLAAASSVSAIWSLSLKNRK
jgi:hypothetical protein